MQYLVLCTCYHSLERHGESGCAGDDVYGCPCVLNKAEALDAAISAAANDSWRAHQGISMEA